MLIKIERNKVKKLMKMPKYKANGIIEQINKICNKPKPEGIIEVLKIKVRIYYKWKKDMQELTEKGICWRCGLPINLTDELEK